MTMSTQRTMGGDGAVDHYSLGGVVRIGIVLACER